MRLKIFLTFLSSILCDIFVPALCPRCQVNPPFENPIPLYYKGPVLSPAAQQLLSNVAIATTLFTNTEDSKTRPHFFSVMRELQEFRQLLPQFRLYIFHNHNSSINLINSSFPLLQRYTENILVDMKGKHPFDFAHSYRPLFEFLVKHALVKPTTFVFLEEDMLLKWDALISWANDNIYLEPLGYLRSFFRIVYHYSDGCLTLTDQTQPQQLKNVISLNQSLFLSNSTADESPPVHEHYIQLSQPYCGMFVASYQQMQRHVESSLWNVKSYRGYGIREMASSGIQFSFQNKAVVPLQERMWNPAELQAPFRPSMFAAVHHLSWHPEDTRGGFNILCPEKLFIK